VIGIGRRVTYSLVSTGKRQNIDSDCESRRGTWELFVPEIRLGEVKPASIKAFKPAFKNPIKSWPSNSLKSQNGIEYPSVFDIHLFIEGYVRHPRR
jgi:hypothetical protein